VSVCYMVFYRGHAEHAQLFVDRYRNIHVPILKRLPGIQSVELLTPLPWEDKHPVKPGEFALIAKMKFKSLAALEYALNSPERDTAREDFGKFPEFEGTVWHQAMLVEI
jgi:uncharacterized protein (TIGR02118 family)